MKKAVIILMAAFLFGITIYFVFKKEQDIKNVPLKNDTILIFGDSLAEGYGSTEGNDLASRLEKRLGRPVLNYGKSGSTTREAMGRLSEISQEDPGLAIIILGGNDVLKRIPKEETFNNLEKIIIFFQDKGAAVALVGIRSGLFGNGYGNYFSSLAEKTDSLYAPDILEDIFSDPRYMSDPIHPNDAGYALIEERFYKIINGI